MIRTPDASMRGVGLFPVSFEVRAEIRGLPLSQLAGVSIRGRGPPRPRPTPLELNADRGCVADRTVRYG